MIKLLEYNSANKISKEEMRLPKRIYKSYNRSILKNWMRFNNQLRQHCANQSSSKHLTEKRLTRVCNNLWFWPYRYKLYALKSYSSESQTLTIDSIFIMFYLKKHKPLTQWLTTLTKSVTVNIRLAETA